MNRISSHQRAHCTRFVWHAITKFKQGKVERSERNSHYFLSWRWFGVRGENENINIWQNRTYALFKMWNASKFYSRIFLASPSETLYFLGIACRRKNSARHKKRASKAKKNWYSFLLNEWCKQYYTYWNDIGNRFRLHSRIQLLSKNKSNRNDCLLMGPSYIPNIYV